MINVRRYGAPTLRAVEVEHSHCFQVVLASAYDRDLRAARYALEQWQRNSRENKQIAEENSARAGKAEAERDTLRAQVEAMRLLLQQCDNDITEDGGVYIELRAFLFGTLPAEDVIALLGEQPVSQAKP